MKKAIVTLGLVIIGLSAFAQRGDDATPEERAERQTAMLAKRLELTEEQQQKVLALNLAQLKSREENKNQDREKFKAQREAYQKDLETILTKEQLEKMKAMREENRQNRGEGRGKRPAPQE